jgi:hypothetical protein
MSSLISLPLPMVWRIQLSLYSEILPYLALLYPFSLVYA